MRRLFAIAPLLLVPILLASPPIWANSLTVGDGESNVAIHNAAAPQQKQSSASNDAERRVRAQDRADFVAEVGDIYDACNGSGTGAGTKFQDKVIEVTGVVESISLTPPRLNLGERDRWFGGVLTCDFGADSDSGLAKIADGETVTARGLFRSCGTQAVLTGCMLSHPREGSLSRN